MDLPPTSLINSVASSAISHKTNLHVQHTFLYTSLPLFCTTKTLNFLVTHYFYGGIVLCSHQKFCCLCSCSLLFFPYRSFSPRCNFLFSHRCYEIFMFLFQGNSSPLFSITRSSSFYIINVSVNIKNNVEKYSIYIGMSVLRTDGRSGGHTVK